MTTNTHFPLRPYQHRAILQLMKADEHWPRMVKMDGDSDCGAACLAMALGMKTASSAYPLLGYNPNESAIGGVYDQEISTALFTMGYPNRVILPREQFIPHVKQTTGSTEALNERVCLPTEQEVRQKLGAQQLGFAIVGVPSLNNEGGFHFVFVHRGEIYDPSNERCYIGMAQSLPIVSAIIVEGSV